MRFLYHIDHGAQLFEEDGVDHTGDGWFAHPAEAGLEPIFDPNGPTKWVKPAGTPAPPPSPPTPVPPEPEPAPLWAQIPADWADQHWKTQCALAGQIAGEPVSTKPEAERIITAELARRKA